MTDNYGPRAAVYMQFRSWRLKYDPSILVDISGGVYNDHAKHLCWLLDRNVRFDAGMNESEVKICQALAGPNGFAIYKMLLARRCSDG